MTVDGNGDENPKCSVVAESMKMLANTSYGYQIIDHSRQFAVKYLDDGKMHAAINKKLFKGLACVGDQLSELELVKNI